MANTMNVIKRNGEIEPVSFDKVLKRIRIMSEAECLDKVNIYEIAQKVCARIYDGVHTSELDVLTAQICYSLILENPQYERLALQISISNHHKNTSPSFSETIGILASNKDVNGNSNPLVSEAVINVVAKNKDKLNSVLNYDRDYTYGYFGFTTLENSYLTKVNGKVVERPQHMLMRVALGIHGTDIKDAIETYELMSKRYYTHATPTLFNAGTPHPQCSSCFLLSMDDDSIDGIFNILKECALISKRAGGIGLNISKIRGKNSLIRGTNGESSGIIPMLRVFNNTARYVDQAGKRNGSFAVYIEMHHKDIEDFLNLRKNHGSEEFRARDLFYALWISDLFMKRVKNDEMWSLMCPDKCKGLNDVYGDEYERLYSQYEEKGMYDKQIKAQDLWRKILTMQIESGVPYMLYKDHVNRKNNQMNLGTIKSSNLCTEIVEYTDDNETAVCNLASICLPTFIRENKFDFGKLHDVVKIIVKNLNKVIDVTMYPVEKAKVSNSKHRPLGIGVQGLADMFVILKMPFESEQAKQLNKDIFETIYHGALESSMNLAQKHGKIYDSFIGSPASKGILQFDMWGANVKDERHNWTQLKKDIMSTGLLNSLLIAPMPTASTSQIMGYNEAFEPFTSNIYTRKTLAGEFIIVNKYLIESLEDIGLWNNNMKQKIILDGGSIQNIDEIPQDIKDIFKMVWEMKQKNIIDMAADRGIFVDQSQSMNLFVNNPDFQIITKMHFYAWEKGLKTGMYYLRTKTKAKAQQFTMDQGMARFTNFQDDSPQKPQEKKEKSDQVNSGNSVNQDMSGSCSYMANVDGGVCMSCSS
jgi:ribonucleoside-diphosphate reductase alpha chain